jgi:hypothetical protein
MISDEMSMNMLTKPRAQTLRGNPALSFERVEDGSLAISQTATATPGRARGLLYLASMAPPSAICLPQAVPKHACVATANGAVPQSAGSSAQTGY